MWITKYSDDPLLWPKSREGVCVGEPALLAGLAHTQILPKIQTPCTPRKPCENRLESITILSLLPTLFREDPLFLRRQLSLYIERGIKPRRIDPVTRVRLTLLSNLFDWRDALVVVRPETLLGWHRSAWKRLWRVKSRPGRPAIPPQLQGVIRRMATENPRWGEERIANELLLKLGIQVSLRTVRKYMPRHPPGRSRGDLR